MFNNFFEKLAEKQLTTVTPLDRLNDELFHRRCERLGAITEFENGVRAIDMVKVQADNLKRGLFYVGVVVPAAAIIGNILGSMDS